MLPAHQFAFKYFLYFLLVPNSNYYLMGFRHGWIYGLWILNPRYLNSIALGQDVKAQPETGEKRH